MILITPSFFRFQHTPDGRSKTLYFFEKSQVNPKGKATLSLKRCAVKKFAYFETGFLGFNFRGGIEEEI